MMNWFDYLLIAIVIYFALVGWHRGLIRQVFAVAGVIASYLVALRYGNEFILWFNKYLPLTEWFPQWFDSETFLGFSLGEIIVRILGFAILFALVTWLFAVTGSIVHGIFSLPVLGSFNGIGGMILGMIKGILLVLIIVGLARLIGTPPLVQMLEESKVAAKAAAILPVIYEQMVSLILADLR